MELIKLQLSTTQKPLYGSCNFRGTETSINKEEVRLYFKQVNVFYGLLKCLWDMIEKCTSTGKVRFQTASEATESIIRIRSRFKYLLKILHIKRKRGKPAQKRVYFCNDCSGFHQTSWKLKPHKLRIQETKRRRKLIKRLGLVR